MLSSRLQNPRITPSARGGSESAAMRLSMARLGSLDRVVAAGRERLGHPASLPISLRFIGVRCLLPRALRRSCPVRYHAGGVKSSPPAICRNFLHRVRRYFRGGGENQWLGRMRRLVPACDACRSRCPTGPPSGTITSERPESLFRTRPHGRVRSVVSCCVWA
jgi:hypothetical protein